MPRLRQGWWVEEKKGNAEFLSWKTHSQLWVFTSPWHVCGCFHSDWSKGSWDVSEIWCAECCWLLNPKWEMIRENRKWERKVLTHHYLSLNLWESSELVSIQRPAALFVCYSHSQLHWLGFKHTCVIRVNGKVQLQQSASHQIGVLHILLNDSLTWGNTLDIFCLNHISEIWSHT